MSFTAREFRDALGLFPTGIAVVTTVDGDGRPAGVTVNSFTSVSLEPPLILVSLARTSRSFDAFTKAKHFAVSLLRHDQRQVSSAFASMAGERFSQVRHRAGLGGCLIIEPHLVAFHCDVYARHDGGDHVLILGKVTQIEPGKDAVPKPLLYFRGQYRELSEQHAEIAPFRLEGW
ncbi:MAG TPA: flavin reductase family protein [Stellaceae bacterium]|nr:flavin reductase family protein [Stellaceae bacterium]